MDFSLLNNLIYKIVFFYFKVDLIGSLLSIQTPNVLRHWWHLYEMTNNEFDCSSKECGKGVGGVVLSNEQHQSKILHLFMVSTLSLKQWFEKKRMALCLLLNHFQQIKYVTFLQSYTKLDWVLFRTSVA